MQFIAERFCRSEQALHCLRLYRSASRDYGLVSIVQQKFGLLAPQQPYQNGLGYTDTLRVGAVSISINEGSSAKLL